MNAIPAGRKTECSGAALIWVILLTGFMAFVALAFLSSSSIQNNAARQSQSDTLAGELLHAAEQEVLAKLHEGFQVEVSGARTGHVAATPGLLEIRRYDTPWNCGSQTGAAAFQGTKDAPAPFSQPFSATFNGVPANPLHIPLFSWRVFAPRLKNLMVNGGTPAAANPDYNPALSFNINTPRNPFIPGACLLSGVPEDAETLVRERTGTQWSGTDFLIGTGQTSAERPVWVQWIPILKDPSHPPGPANPVVGRYAYWVDVENSKLNVSDFIHDLRDRTAFARLIGEPDSQDGGGSPHEQTDGSTYRSLRLALESGLPALDKKDAAASVPRAAAASPGLASAAALEARESWLGWQDGRPPLACAVNVVDWTWFCAPWQRGFGDLTVATAIQERFRDWQNKPDSRPLHPWFIRQPRPPDEPPLEKARAQLLAQVATGSLTTFGHEEDLDPLGLPKLSLPDFQNQATGGGASIVSTSAIQASTLWSRLNDRSYAACYFPGLLPMKGSPKSLADSFNRFAGTGAASGTANGQAALLQMLVNIAEARQPDSVPPLIDRTLGIVGARSIPYVIEVATRARSLLHELPEHLRTDRETLLRRNAAGAYVFRHNGRHLRHYATNVALDLIVSLVNPNPFETQVFDGTLEVDVSWMPGLPSSANVVQRQGGTVSVPLRGLYAATPEPGKAPRSLRILGDCVHIPLGTLPGVLLDDDSRPNVLRIRGWRIKRGDQIWHEVPVAAPGQPPAREWWRMSDSQGNLGQGSRSLKAYAEGGYRAVGWFTKAAMRSLVPDSLFVSDWTSDTQSDDELVKRVGRWGKCAPYSTLMDAVISTDPVLGHRTGSLSPPGMNGQNGHFYGALGHTWRHLPYMSSSTPPPLPAETAEPRLRTMKTARWTASQTAPASRNVRIRQAQSGRLRQQTVSVPLPAWSLTRENEFTGTCMTGGFLDSGASPWTETDDTLPARLASLYLCPQIASPAPQGRHAFEDYDDIKILDSSGNELASLRDLDIELPASSLPPAELKEFTKRMDLKKGPRGFFCSAPPKRPFVTVGEIGFVHSGFPLTPIIVGPDEGRTPYHLNSPLNGPPMRIMLDQLSTPRLTGGGTQTTSSHAWNINTLVAHDEYLALRQGGDTLRELKKEVSPSSMPLRAIWCPGAQSYARRETGADGFLGNDAEQLVKKDPGHIQDRHIRPFITLARPWNMWMGVLAGDFSPQRAGDSLSWGAGNRAGLYFGPALMAWRPGLGSGAGDKSYVDFLSHLPGHGRLLALGEDGRKDAENTNIDFLKGRFAADQNLAALDPNLPAYLPAHFATRLSLVPMRHFVSDLAVDFHQNNHESDWLRLKTALNPGLGGQTPPPPNGSEDAAKNLAGSGFPGGSHQGGVFYNAPMALMTSQAGVSANAFTAYLVVQSLRDRGKRRDGIPNSGPGHCDPDDEVLAERWARLIIVKEPRNSAAPAFQIVFRDVAGR